MIEKFNIEELMIRVIPGGFFLVVLFHIYGDIFDFTKFENVDFLYTFIFFCISFIMGEVLQTIAHQTEWLIDVFFKFRRPSKVFLYKKNPVLKSQNKRNELIQELNLDNEEKDIFNKSYSELSFLFIWNRKVSEDDLSQSIFWRLYSKVSDTEEMKIANRGYLFSRVLVLIFLINSILYTSNSENILGIINFILFIIFLWRSRGNARGLVFKTVLMYLKK